MPPSVFYTNIGKAGVTVFFMITGYLFWTQILRAEGRPDFLKLLYRQNLPYNPVVRVLSGHCFCSGWRVDALELAGLTNRTFKRNG